MSDFYSIIYVRQLVANFVWLSIRCEQVVCIDFIWAFQLGRAASNNADDSGESGLSFKLLNRNKLKVAKKLNRAEGNYTVGWLVPVCLSLWAAL